MTSAKYKRASENRPAPFTSQFTLFLIMQLQKHHSQKALVCSQQGQDRALLVLGALGLLFILAARSSDTAISQYRYYRGQHQDKEQENNKLDRH